MTGLTAANRMDKRRSVMKANFAGFALREIPTCGFGKTLANGLKHNKRMANSGFCKVWLKTRRRL
eukprot:8655965-Heterocapsa_arctica.AAC.1